MRQTIRNTSQKQVNNDKPQQSEIGLITLGAKDTIQKFGTEVHMYPQRHRKLESSVQISKKGVH
jgi:hypothetical protein